LTSINKLGHRLHHLKDMSPGKPITPHALPTMAVLSSREREVLSYLVQGKSAKSTALILGISARTVSVHSASIIRKLRAKNRTHAVAIAIRAEDAAPES
jgi:DNA-binding CsgD family transcriptional regulator